MASGQDCWANCPTCDVDFTLGCVVPCPVDVYIAALKAARCPKCGVHKGVMAYEPGRTPAQCQTKTEKSFTFAMGFR